MKHWDTWLILGVTILLIALAVLMHGYIGASAARVLAPLDNLAQAVEQEDWLEARRLFGQSHGEWQQVRLVWPMLINHNELRDVERAFLRTQILLEQEDGPQAAQEIVELGYYLRHVPNDERLTWQNIL